MLPDVMWQLHVCLVALVSIVKQCCPWYQSQMHQLQGWVSEFRDAAWATAASSSSCHEAGALCVRCHIVRRPRLLATLSAQPVHCFLHLHKDLRQRHGASLRCRCCRLMFLSLARLCVIMTFILTALQSESSLLAQDPIYLLSCRANPLHMICGLHQDTDHVHRKRIARVCKD